MPLNTVYKQPPKQTDHHPLISSFSSVLLLGQKDLLAMKVFLLSCLVALALAKERELIVSSETVGTLSSSEESITNINKERSEKIVHEKQLGREDGRQDSSQPLVQPQPLFYPFAEPIPYTVLPQNVLPLAQPAMALPILQPQVMEVPSAKETIFPKRSVMPFLRSPVVPVWERQIPSLTDLKTPQLPLPLLQPLMHQVPQPLLQTPVFPAQPLMHQVPQPLLQTPVFPAQPLVSVSQPKALRPPQQVMTYPQANVPVQEPLLEATQQFYPVTQPIAPVFTFQQN